MKKYTLFTIILTAFLSGFFSLNAQDFPATCYRLYLHDKAFSPYSISRPQEFLSERAIAKRQRFNIPVTAQDFPVNPNYIQQVKNVDSDIRLLASCKWLNTITVYCPNTSALESIQQLAFVDSLIPVANYDLSLFGPTFGPLSTPEYEPQTVVLAPKEESYDYGAGYAQIAIHNGHLLHDAGFHGEDMLIAVFDAGWDSVDTIASFANLFEEGRVWGTVDLIPWRNNVYDGHYHGTLVTSTMAAENESALVGTAPKANYFFIRSEEPDMEQLIEEDFWAQAACIADSIGADVINSSLGYTNFADFPQVNNSYWVDMDGQHSIASLAATILGQKGVIVCISAGNDGANEWHYISHPCDAFDVLAIGAADIEGNAAAFSSRGPSTDGRVKPDIASVGVSTACIWPDDIQGVADGTSLAGPVAAGLCACLWQALPEKTSHEMMQIIREAGSCFDNPNDSLGYGIPDFYAAYLNNQVGISERSSTTVEVFPNPCTDVLHVSNGGTQVQRVDLYSMSGTMVKSYSSSSELLIRLNVSDLAPGMYVGKVWMKDGSVSIFKVVK